MSIKEGAAPSSEEVREMVERLRNDETDLFRLQEQAADLIERLAARADARLLGNNELIRQIAAMTQERDGWKSVATTITVTRKKPMRFRTSHRT
jgi:hypothetical protein